MKTKYFNFGMFGLLFSLVLYGCGGGTGGAPGSSGSGDTGIVIKSVNIAPGGGTGTASPDLDVHNTVCSVDTTTGVTTFESPMITRDDATLTIDATKINPNLVSDPFPASIEQCTITYLKVNEDPSAPIIPSLTIYPNCTLLDSATNTCVVTLIDLQRKLDFFTNINNGLNLPSEYPTHYVAQYDCSYMGNFGKSGNFRVELDIWLADFNRCG